MWRGFSWKFSVISCHKLTVVWFKLTPNFMTIVWHWSRLHSFSMLNHDIDFRGVQVMEFPWHLLRKWWDFHRIWSHFQPNCSQKDKNKSLPHFLQGKLIKKFGFSYPWSLRKTMTVFWPTSVTISSKKSLNLSSAS